MTSQFYPAFLKEYHGQEYLETADGFITYSINEEYKTLHMGDIYIIPERRKTLACSRLLRELEAIAEKNQCKALTTFVYMRYDKKEWSLLNGLKYGFKILAAAPDKITLGKEL